MPFFGGRSIYKISGSNVIGGITSLPINTGNDNVAIGNNVLQQNTTGSRNIAVGNFALNAVVDGTDNIAIGKNAGFAENSIQSIFIGTDAGFTPASTASVMIGYEAGKNLNAIDTSVIIGGDFKIEAGGSADVRNYSVLIGSYVEAAAAGMSVFVDSSVFIGRQAKAFDIGGSYDVIESVTIGGSLNFDTRKRIAGSVDVGYDAGVDCESDGHVAVGRASLKGANGNNLTAVGDRAGSILAPIDNGIFLGNPYTDDYSTFASFENVFVAGYFTGFGQSYPAVDPKPVYNVILIGDSFHTNQDASVSNTVILGYGNEFSDYTSVENAVLIGSNILTGTPDGSLDDCIIIGGGNVKNDNLKIIQIGNRNATYDEIWFGDQQYTGGGGGIPLEAEQYGTDENVSLIGVMTDTVSNIETSYSLEANHDNQNTVFYLAAYNNNTNLNSLNEITVNESSVSESFQSFDPNNSLMTGISSNADVSNGGTSILINSTGDSSIYGEPFVSIDLQATDANLPTTSGYLTLYTAINNSALTAGISDRSTGEYSTVGFENTPSIASIKAESSPDGVTTNTVEILAIDNDACIRFTGSMAVAGTDTPVMGTNAPIAGLEITSWIKVNVNGVDGYLPFFSVPI